MRTRARFCLSALLVTTAVAAPATFTAPAAACGGFFCGQQPVDQTAERILFELGADSVTMTTQIAFNGDAADFAWILPLPEVPAADSLEVYPQRALTALDSNSGPVFLQPDDPECYVYDMRAAGGGPTLSGTDNNGPPPVTVHIRQEVGDYDVAVIESTDPTALIEWLRQNQYRVTEPMEPYIALYTKEGMKFLALKLVNGADVSDIQPFRFTLPGTVPSIPLRMTALAAEPEMSILVFVLGQDRFGGKNWDNLEIDDGKLRFNPRSFGSSNWTSLVAKAVDEAGGQGWVTEFAGPSADYATRVAEQLANGNFGTPEDRDAAERLHAALTANPYMTRLYTRLSAEEMTTDPVLGRVAGGTVDREHQMQRIVDGIDQCSQEIMDAVDPCDFVTCGQGGVCRAVTEPDGFGGETKLAACGCVPGATARTTFAPDGSATVICQDQRLSFLNPGDRETPESEPLPDPCATFDCGPNGRCVPMNMTPTCECDEGFVATGSFADTGKRLTSCVEPNEAVPSAFYLNRLPALPEATPGGRQVDVPGAETRKSGGGFCSVGAPAAPPARPWFALLGLGVALAARRRNAR